MLPEEAALAEKAPAAGTLEWLLARAIAGDEAAFTQLYDDHYDRIYRYVYYRVRRVEDAEDLTQKVFLKAWRGLGRYQRTTSPFIAWLITIAHNETMSFFRSRKPVEPIQYDPASQDGEITSKDPTAGYDEQEQIREAILQLGSEQQQVITMRFLEDLDYSEIAAALGKTQGAVRVLQHRALQRLRALLRGGVDDKS